MESEYTGYHHLSIVTYMLTDDLQQQYSEARLSRDARFDGRFYVGVKSTGIFCRPICPARLPDEQNVTYFQFAQQAIEQGYRPCLRCRPDSAPGSYAWLGKNTTLQRALRLLSEDVGSTVVDVASRLGISERYLNKLVTQQVGLSPKRYQLHSQLLLAKRLLQQTALPVSAVADAVGFASVRSLQTHLKKYLRLTPLQLRHSEACDATQPVTLFVPVKQPYNWPQVRDFLNMRALNKVETVSESQYQRNFQIHGHSGVVYAEYSAAKNGFKVTIDIAQPQYLYPILLNLKRVLDVDADPALISTAIERSGLAPELLTPGLRLPGVWSYFEAGCRAIVGQQVSVKAAITQLQRLVDSLGTTGKMGREFPTPQAVAASSLEMLKMPGARKQALRSFAQAVANSDNQQLNDEELLGIKGVGPWTLEYVKLRGMSEPDRFLEQDLIIKKQVKYYQIRGERAAPWRSYLTIQLWHLASQHKGQS